MHKEKDLKKSRWEMELSDDDRNEGYKNQLTTEKTINDDGTIGLVWVDDLKKNKDDYVLRYEISMNNMPMPAAFKQAIIALRFMIRAAKKEGKEYIHYLNRLYELAVWFSFMPGPYEEKLKMPCFTIFEQIRGGLVANLPFKYEEIGYEKITLLKKNDIKLLIQHFGEPQSHKTLHEKYKDEWERQLELFSTVYMKRMRISLEDSIDFTHQDGKNFLTLKGISQENIMSENTTKTQLTPTQQTFDILSLLLCVATFISAALAILDSNSIIVYVLAGLSVITSISYCLLCSKVNTINNRTEQIEEMLINMQSRESK